MSDGSDDSRRTAGGAGYIGGIYNYCDRWCTRCPMSSRCSVFAMERAEQGSAPQPEAGDVGEMLSDCFEATVALLHELAAEAGIDVDAAAGAAGDTRRPSCGDGNVLVAYAGRYRSAVSGWLAAHERRPVDGGRLRRVPSATADPPTGDLIDVVQWYHTLIHAKLFRAVAGESPDPSAGPGDGDGSAKVAIIAIDRSAAAWRRLIARLPADRAAILDFLGQLARLRRAAQWAFPRALDFPRPGFDDPL